MYGPASGVCVVWCCPSTGCILVILWGCKQTMCTTTASSSHVLDWTHLRHTFWIFLCARGTLAMYEGSVRPSLWFVTGPGEELPYGSCRHGCMAQQVWW